MEGKRPKYYRAMKIKYSLRLDKSVIQAKVACWDNTVKLRYFSKVTGKAIEETFSPDHAVRDLPEGYRDIEVWFDANKDARCFIDMLGRGQKRLGAIQMEYRTVGATFEVVEFGGE